MKTKTLRIIIPLAILAVAGIAFAVNAPVGTLSSFGWESLSLICPVGSLGTLLASKTFIPRALISLVIAVVAIILLGRAFCGWICPVPVVSKLRGIFKKKSDMQPETREIKPLSAEEMEALKGCSRGCGSCASKGAIDSRHLVLGGSLLSAAIFGFPVFCLVCPIGLTFGLVFLLIALFGSGDVSWTVVAVPVVLLLEVVFFRKWCSHICPLSALMSLISRANRTVLPSIDNEKCLETSKGASCGRCGSVCEVGIDPRHPELGANWAECIKCNECAEACPTGALKIALMPKKNASPLLVEAKTPEKQE